jgi:hypothetical protein
MSFFANLLKKFKSLKGWFSSSKPEPSLEVTAITKQFNLLEEARKLGELGLPSFHSKSITATEQEVVRYIEGVREQIQIQTLADLNRMDRLIHESQVHEFDLKPDILSNDFERKALIIFNEQNLWLQKLGTTANRRFKELEKFRLRHQLDRDAIYPDGTGLFLRYALLFLLITFEGVFNSAFFAEGLSTGLLGGFLYAVSLASINVLTAFILGKTAVRWLFHIQPVVKAFGLLALGIALGFITTMALAIGHLRTVILLESANPTQEAWLALVNNPLGLNDLAAWILFLVTIGFGLASLIDGLFIDDLYPGYGAITRREKQATEEFEEEFEDVRASLEEVKQENIDALDDEIQRAKQFASRFRQQIEDKKTVFQSWMQKLNESEVALYACLRIFRAENNRHRKDALRPAYFDTLPTLRGVAIEKPDLSPYEQAHTHLQERIKLLEDSLPTRREKIYNLFDRHVEQLNFIQHPPTFSRKDAV